SGCARRIIHFQGRERVGDPVDLGLTDPDHEVVVGRVVGDVAVTVALLQAADPVLQAGGAGDGPRTGQGLLVAQVGPVLLGGRTVLGRDRRVGGGRGVR